ITAASTNASTDAVTITQVSDNKLGDLTADALAANNGNAIVLSAGQSFSFTVTRTLTVDAKDGSFTNMVTATGTDDENNPVSDDDTHTATVTDLTPTITVTKSVSPGTVQEGTSGQQVTYTYLVTNTSAASTDPLTLTELLDDRAGDI